MWFESCHLLDIFDLKCSPYNVSAHSLVPSINPPHLPLTHEDEMSEERKAIHMKKLVWIKPGRSKCHKTYVYSFGYNEEQNEPLSGEDPLKLMISMQTFRSIKVSPTGL